MFFFTLTYLMFPLFAGGMERALQSLRLLFSPPVAGQPFGPAVGVPVPGATGATEGDSDETVRDRYFQAMEGDSLYLVLDRFVLSGVGLTKWESLYRLLNAEPRTQVPPLLSPPLAPSCPPQ